MSFQFPNTKWGDDADAAVAKTLSIGKELRHSGSKSAGKSAMHAFLEYWVAFGTFKGPNRAVKMLGWGSPLFNHFALF